jgi:hypothetical protein
VPTDVNTSREPPARTWAEAITLLAAAAIGCFAMHDRVAQKTAANVVIERMA